MKASTLLSRAGVLGERNFALFWLGYGVSLTGSGMVPVALTFAILGQGYGAAEVGLVLAAETAAMVVLLLFGGVIADRFTRKHVMVVSDVVRCIAQLSFAALLLTSHPPIGLAMIVGAVLGAGQAFFGPALTGLVPEITSAARLQDANALIGIAKWAGRVAGPALAGLLVASGGAPWAILVDALTYAIGAGCLLALDRPPERKIQRPEPILRQLRLGWNEFASQRWLWIIVVQFGFYHMLVMAPIMVLGALIAEQHLGGASAWGLILSGEGVGAVLGGVFSMRFKPHFPLVWATLGTFAGLPLLLLLAWIGPLWAIVLAAGFWGGGLAVFTVLFDTTMQEQVPPEALSRVSSYDWLGSYALIPLGYALAGPLSALLGNQNTLKASAVWLLLTSALVIFIPAINRLRSAAAAVPITVASALR